MRHRESYNSRHNPFRLLGLPSHPKEAQRLCLKECENEEGYPDENIEGDGEFRYDSKFIVGEDAQEEAEDGGFDQH